jgi:hypothetical protein
LPSSGVCVVLNNGNFVNLFCIEVSFVSGSATGFVVTGTLQPFDVIKTRIIGRQAVNQNVMVNIFVLI